LRSIEVQVEFLLHGVVSGASHLVEYLLEGIQHGRVDNVGFDVRDRLVRDVVYGVVQILLGQGHKEAIDPVDALRAELAVSGGFRPEEELHVFFFQPQGIGEGGDDHRLQQSLDQLVAGQGDAVLMEDLAADNVVDSRLEVVSGDHQVGGAAAHVDAGDADLLARVAESLFFGRGAVPRTTGPAHAGPTATSSGRGRRLWWRLLLFGRLRLPATLVQRAEPQFRVLPQHHQLTPDVGQVNCTGLVDAEVQLGLDALVFTQGHLEDVDRLLRLGLEAFLLLADHPAGMAQGEGTDFPGAAGVARGRPVGH